jgi:hypothetical protein
VTRAFVSVTNMICGVRQMRAGEKAVMDQTCSKYGPLWHCVRCRLCAMLLLAMLTHGRQSYTPARSQCHPMSCSLLCRAAAGNAYTEVTVKNRTHKINGTVTLFRTCQGGSRTFLGVLRGLCDHHPTQPNLTFLVVVPCCWVSAPAVAGCVV